MLISPLKQFYLPTRSLQKQIRFYRLVFLRHPTLSRNNLLSSKVYTRKSSDQQLIGISADALEFYKTCRRQNRESTVESFTADQHACPDRIQEINSQDGRVIMYALPVHMNWPTFYASKQTKATDKHLFFQQMSSTHSKRFNAIVDHLRNGKKVVSTGLAGIGKSTELNAYLMKFLANIGNPNWPPEVWYRFDSNLLQFYLNGDEPKVKYFRRAYMFTLPSLLFISRILSV